MATQPALPDVNAQTYPYELVQYLLDQTASLSMFATPDPSFGVEATLTPGHPEDFFGINGGYGLDLKNHLRRFDSTVRFSGPSGFSVVESIGESEASMRCRLLFGAPDFTWSPSGEPFCMIFDPWRSQRFAIRNFDVQFRREDGFTGYGVGRTYPMVVDGKPILLMAAMGNATEGRGKFHGLQGSFTLSGRITGQLGFVGNVTIRFVDPDARLRSDREVSGFNAVEEMEPDATFIVMRLAKKSASVQTTYGPPTGLPGIVSLVTPSQIRTGQFGLHTHGYGGLRTEISTGQVIGSMDADVRFNLLATPGTAEKPVPFMTSEVYTFTDGSGRVVGTIECCVEEGESFNLRFPAAPRQAGVRFAGVGPVTGGTGIFAGARGTLAVNSVIGIAPHALSLVHVIQLRDPTRRLRHETTN